MCRSWFVCILYFTVCVCTFAAIGKIKRQTNKTYPQIMRCFSVCWCSHLGHLYWTSSYSKPYSFAMWGMKFYSTSDGTISWTFKGNFLHQNTENKRNLFPQTMTVTAILPQEGKIIEFITGKVQLFSNMTNLIIPWLFPNLLLSPRLFANHLWIPWLIQVSQFSRKRGLWSVSTLTFFCQLLSCTMR